MWRKKRSWEPPIRIPTQWFESLMKNMKRELKEGFESLTQRFESLYLEFWWTRLGDSNLRDTDSNPSAKLKAEDWRSEESDSNLRVMDSNPSWRKIQISLKWFESPTQRFESLLTQNSNLAQAIRIPYTAIRIPDSAEALNARPATPSTRFSS